ncbi:hypothetical protein, unlikely [Trypanosoma brucei gambiense DAL972]|uniref:Uncharacterized protein n=1 Tax=Trypanosoma brucei gambiense (strain MHOM/CI/86/DAL972) TaxID=679716 RepID=D0A707_TRYB9|nr:hypothetical protein, unlikely [Trypanosoma brucei gambiense DAL972]CBH17458.1 hypothetical protein, unlikely [Trypanosoma brucei gambiense DAL972]|eukprot:XP_011779722.1 hypothetical protein, unlikely [Trypanosoma brucei gambiense DAL972]
MEMVVNDNDKKKKKISKTHVCTCTRVYIYVYAYAFHYLFFIFYFLLSHIHTHTHTQINKDVKTTSSCPVTNHKYPLCTPKNYNHLTTSFHITTRLNPDFAAAAAAAVVVVVVVFAAISPHPLYHVSLSLISFPFPPSSAAHPSAV